MPWGAGAGGRRASTWGSSLILLTDLFPTSCSRSTFLIVVPPPLFPPLGVGLEGHLLVCDLAWPPPGCHQNGVGIEVCLAAPTGRVVGLGPPPMVFATSQPSSGLRGS